MSWTDVELAYDLESFFETYKIINAAGLAQRLKIPQSLMAQYVNGDKKPSAKQTQRILEGVRNVGRELTEMDFAF